MHRAGYRASERKRFCCSSHAGVCTPSAADELVAATEHKKPRGPPDGGIFDKMLKEPCPYHKGPTNLNLEDCHMLWRYFESLGTKKDDKRDEK